MENKFSDFLVEGKYYTGEIDMLLKKLNTEIVKVREMLRKDGKDKVADSIYLELTKHITDIRNPLKKIR